MVRDTKLVSVIGSVTIGLLSLR